MIKHNNIYIIRPKPGPAHISDFHLSISYTCSREDLIPQLIWKSLQAPSIFHRVTSEFQCLLCDGELFFREYYSQNTRRNGMGIILPKINKEIANKVCLVYLRVKDFNGRPKEVKTVNSLLLFESKLRVIKNSLISSVYYLVKLHLVIISLVFITLTILLSCKF